MKGHHVLSMLAAAALSLFAPTSLAESPAGWVLNLQKSALAENREPLRAALGSSPAHTALMLAATGVAPRGHEGALVLEGDQLSFEAGVRFKARLDGQDYPISGLPAGDTIAITVDDGDAVVSTIKSGGSKVASFHRSLSPDERTMILTARYFGSDGRVARERLVFERR